MATTDRTVAGSAVGLRRDATGLREVLFQGVGGFMVLGLIYMLYLYRTNPGRITDVGLVHLDGDL